MRTLLKLGTRRSRLAWAQSSWVAAQLEKLNPGIRVELYGIDTRGDKILDVSLQSVAGKEFFVAELDNALKSKVVDLTVHSMKDLSLDRPAEFVLGAVPPRENPRDVILFGPEGLRKISHGEPIRIGTSSPRRLENIPVFIERAVPATRDGKRSPADFVEIRGNVNTRLSRVHEPAGAAKQLDGVVLAFAGIIRLWADTSFGGRNELTKLLNGVRWMVLPLRENPTAPGQGALAVECRANDSEVRAVLEKLHDSKSATQTARERGILAEWGGGCHQKFGATELSTHEGLDLLFIRGLRPDGVFVDEMNWQKPARRRSSGTPVLWAGSEWRAKSGPTKRGALGSAPKAEAYFVAHSRALPHEWISQISDTRVWTSGTQSWFKLADQGVWVEGCAESLGFEDLRPTIAQPVLGLPDFSNWKVLTHETATGWNPDQVVATYSVESEYGADAIEALKRATHIYWSSGSQLNAVKKHIPSDACHACGPGKTAGAVREAGFAADVFPSVEEWKKWTQG